MGFFLTDVLLALVGLLASIFIVLSIVGIGEAYHMFFNKY